MSVSGDAEDESLGPSMVNSMIWQVAAFVSTSVERKGKPYKGSLFMLCEYNKEVPAMSLQTKFLIPTGMFI